MLGDKEAIATVAVKDLVIAREFYETKLGLTPLKTEDDEVIVFQSGSSRLLVYRSQYAGTNQATSVSWSVGDELEAIVNELQSKGIHFEHYDLPGMSREGDIHAAGSMRVAWLKDPDGNILSIAND